MKGFLFGHWLEIEDRRIFRDCLIFYGQQLRWAIWIMCAFALGYFVGGLW